MPQLSSLNGAGSGVSFDSATGETELYLAVGDPAKVDVFGVGLCGTLECASLQQEWTGTPSGSFSSVRDVAVDTATDWASGDVFVTDFGTGANAVDVFKPRAGGGDEYVTSLTGTAPSEPFSQPEKVAVSGLNGDVVVEDGGSRVDVFEPEGTDTYVFKGRLALPGGSEAIQNLAVDGGTGEIYAATSSAIYEYGPELALRGQIAGAETPEQQWSGETLGPRGLAVDPVSHRVFVGVFDSGERDGVVDVFGPDVVVPDVTVGSASSPKIESATHTWSVEVSGTVNPLNEGQATCTVAWGRSPALEDSTPCPGVVPNGETAAAETTTLAKLAPDTTYYYRLEATNKNGTNPGEPSEDRTFHTPGPGLSEESVLEISASSARLEARVNPDEVATSYYFEYDTREYMEAEGPHGSRAPLANAAIGGGEEDVEVEQQAQGLAADTTYHYRVVATDEIEGGKIEEFDGPDQTFVTQPPGGSLTLPDGRTWELVSPPDKHGATIAGIGESGVSQAAASGEAFTFLATAPTEPKPQGYDDSVQLLATRGPDGWSALDIATPHIAPVGLHPGNGDEYRFFSEDLSSGMVEPLGPFSPPESERVYEASPEATDRTPYLRHDATCTAEPTSCYEPLVTGAAECGDVPEGTEFGGSDNVPFGDANFVGSSPDASHAVLKSSIALTAESAPAGGLYEWSAGAPCTDRLALVSQLPSEEGGRPATDPQLGRTGATRDAVSTNGSRVFFSAQGHLYMRETTTHETVQLDAVQGAPEPGEGKPSFQAANREGTKVFFTDEQRLTSHSSANGITNNPKADLYECEIVVVATAGATKPKCELHDLTAKLAGSAGPAEVQGVIGASANGEYVYFVAHGELTESANAAGETAAPSGENLYVERYDGERGQWNRTFIVTLASEDERDWRGNLAKLTSRVSPDGAWLAFMSQRALTGYDNRDAASGVPDEEVYVYDAPTGRLVCASCNPTGARPSGVEYAKLNGRLAGGDRMWPENQWLAANIPGWTPYSLSESLYQSRYLSDSGRLFFDSSDALAPQDINGNEDVYEYEPPGVGNCAVNASTFSARSGGCVGLISSGVAQGESAFLDASENGSDVFFLTTEKLVSQDTDTALDVYDAHECTGSSPCQLASGTAPSLCITADACRAAPASQPETFGAPTTQTFRGAGNFKPQAVTSTAKAKPLTRRQLLGRGLTSCRRHDLAKRKRAACERDTRRRYGSATSTRKRAKRGAR
ncbi:MAG: hypothetical protein FWD42_05910 [Solirubrobacterales bacterium]|nr:hypothetical protein [Solirubrobacterales bacterium]